jgi:hypothetical protein
LKVFFCLSQFSTLSFARVRSTQELAGWLRVL